MLFRSIRLLRSRRGSYTIEASLCLFIFMAAYMFIISLVSALRAETAVQYALDQTALEISGYCYVADRALAVSSANGSSAADGFISAVADLSEIKGLEGESGGGLISGFESFWEKADAADKSFSDTVDSLTTAFEDCDSPAAAVSAVASVIGSAGMRNIGGRIITPFLCRMLMPKYFSGDADSKLRRWGVEDGFEGIDFSLSSVMSDGKNIQLVAEFRIRPQLLGGFGAAYRVRKTSCTAAWISEIPDESESQAYTGIWQLGNFERGKTITSLIKEEFPDKSVSGGTGIDIYDKKTNSLISVKSINIFTASYSVCNALQDESEQKSESYTLNSNRIRSEILSSARELIKASDNLADGEKILLECGIRQQIKSGTRRLILKVVVPNEGAAKMEELSEVAAFITTRTGVEIEYVFKANALD